MAEKTMTEKMAWAAAVQAAKATGDTALEAYATAKLAKMAEKAAKPTAAQVEAMEMAEQMFVMMEIGKAYTASELADLFDVKVPKATALAKRLVAKGVVEKGETKVKGGRMVNTYTAVG